MSGLEAHLEAEAAFLDRLRRRVWWQAEVAYPQLAPRAGSRWSIWDLERRVAGNTVVLAPDRLEELRWHLRYLRFHASADGALPPEFDEYVRGAFAELL
jgi:hypothetical protein